MSGGYGHIAKMARENRIKTANRKERLKNYKKKVGTYKDSKIELEFKEVSEKQLEIIKRNIQKRFRKERIKNRYILVFSIIIGLFMFIKLTSMFLNLIKL